MLTQEKKQFIEFMMSADVLRFGDFVTKSGRNTPYFINTGNFRRCCRGGDWIYFRKSTGIGMAF